jgi:hypothetical protein
MATKINKEVLKGVYDGLTGKTPGVDDLRENLGDAIDAAYANKGAVANAAQVELFKKIYQVIAEYGTDD